MTEGYRLNVSDVLGLEEVQRNRNAQRLEEVVVELYATMRNPLLSYAYHVACSSGDAEDLVQIAFLKLYDQLRSEQSETRQILRLVGEDRQMAVKVHHLGITALES